MGSGNDREDGFGSQGLDDFVSSLNAGIGAGDISGVVPATVEVVDQNALVQDKILAFGDRVKRLLRQMNDLPKMKDTVLDDFLYVHDFDSKQLIDPSYVQVLSALNNRMIAFFEKHIKKLKDTKNPKSKLDKWEQKLIFFHKVFNLHGLDDGQNELSADSRTELEFMTNMLIFRAIILVSEMGRVKFDEMSKFFFLRAIFDEMVVSEQSLDPDFVAMIVEHNDEERMLRWIKEALIDHPDYLPLFRNVKDPKFRTYLEKALLEGSKESQNFYLDLSMAEARSLYDLQPINDNAVEDLSLGEEDVPVSIQTKDLKKLLKWYFRDEKAVVGFMTKIANFEVRQTLSGKK